MKKELPLVTVVCLCYQHERFVAQSLQSVLDQDYPHLQIIVVDDGSTDGSVQTIEQFLSGHKTANIVFLPLKENQGNCKAFNKALALATGKYIIDLATDDLLLRQRISRQVAVFESLPPDYGVVFSDVYLISESGKSLGTYYPRTAQGKLNTQVPSGNVYRHLLQRAFISTPSMMIRKSVLDELGGYDERLSYEDFDFWVRSGRNYRYHFSDELLTKKRMVKGSHSQAFYRKRNNVHLASTLAVCRKALALNQTSEENEALAVCVAYHFRISVFTENRALANAYFQLLTALMERVPVSQRLWLVLAKSRLPVFWLYRLYLNAR